MPPDSIAAAAAPPVPPAEVMPRGQRPFVLAAVMAGMFMIAIEATIVSTAMPQIAARLGNLQYYSWVFSAFLLAQTATTVIFGKLADLFGRRPVLLAGIGIFLAGTVLCGLAWSMPALIVFRLIQGVGAGAIQPLCITVVGDLYSVQERGRIQGWLASVWGISSVLGPLAGGLIIQHASWAWVFWINIPVGLGAAALFIGFLREPPAHAVRSLDVAGAALFAVAVAALMIALTEAGSAGPAVTLGALAVAVVAALLFVWQERRAHDPMVAFALWARRPIATANAVALLSGMTVIGLTTFLPMYVQGVLGHSALVAGFALTAMVLGWPIGATVAARNVTRLGLRGTMLAGAVLLPLGGGVFLLLGQGSSPVLAGAGSLVMGLGMGFVSNAGILIIQTTAVRAERGAATASNIFSRNLGSTLGAAALGAVLNLSLARVGVGPEQIRHLLDQGTATAGDALVRGALDHALHLTFWAILAIAVATLLGALLVPKVPLAARD